MNEMNEQRPILGISAGDPGGIGPEITAKALAMKDIYQVCRPLVVADIRLLEDVLRFTDLKLELNPVQSPAQGRYDYGTIDVLDLRNMDMETLSYKKVTPQQGKASFEYVRKVIELAMNQDIHGTVTGPINKAAIHAGGFNYAGHTEIYASLTKTEDYAMMLADGSFRVAHVSTHVSLEKACTLVKKERVLRVIQLSFDALKKVGIDVPRIAVAGINPHCGEDGLFGLADKEEILPAIQTAVEAGIDVEGPIPADTVFSKMKGGMYDIVVVMYHDQGHIPMKLIGFQYDEKTKTWGAMAGVNVTLGLPIIRTSVDHGTAYGKAGEGRANPESMIAAIEMAAMLSSA